MKVGINLVNHASMTARTFAPAVHGLIDRIREGHPDIPVLVVSPIFCPIAEDRPGPTVPAADGGFETLDADPRLRPGSLTLGGIRSSVASIVEIRRNLGDQQLFHLDGLRLFGAADEPLLYDRLHPTPEGYALLGSRFADLAFGMGGPLAG